MPNEEQDKKARDESPEGPGNICHTRGAAATDSDNDYEDPEQPKEKHCIHRVKYIHPTDITKLNLKYSGDTSVLAFLERLDELVGSRSLNYDQVFRSAAELFSDNALLWYRGIRQSLGSWKDLKEQLVEEFLPPDFEHRLLEELKSRTQGADETFSTFYSIMLGFFNRLRTPLSDEEKLQILRRNVRPEFSDRLALFSITTMTDFRDKCRELERQRIRSQYFSEPPKVTPHTLAADLAYTGRAKQVSALEGTPSQGRDNLFCLRCRIQGHTLKSCTEKGVVCYTCGMKGFTSTKCPNCNKKQNKTAKTKSRRDVQPPKCQNCEKGKPEKN